MKTYMNNISEWISQISLQKKLVFLYVLIILAPVLIFTWNISKNQFEASINDTIRESEYMINLERVNIEKNMESIRRTAQIVVANQEFTEFMSNSEGHEVEELIDFKMNTLSDLLQLKYNNPMIENIHFYAANSHVSEMWPVVYDEKRIVDTVWYEEILELNGKEMWRVQQPGQASEKEDAGQVGPKKISLYREIEYPKDEHLGVIEINMLLKNFFPKIFSGVENSEAQMLVLDKRNTLHYDSSKRLLQGLELTAQDIKDAFLQKNSGDQERVMQFQNQAVPFLIVSSYVEEIGIHVLNVVSLEEIYAERDRLRILIFLGAFSLIVILSFITYFIVRLILKKLHLLIESMKRVEKGDFTVDVDIQGNDEIGRLSNHYRNMLSKINSLIAESVNKEAATKEAELNALKTQIDSHFLYNTLENIKMMAEIDGKYDISDALTSLGEMMRYNLKWKKDFVSLQEEVNHIRNYIDIMNIRLDHRLELNVDVPSHLESQEVLKMSLQPLVENAVKHGLQHILHEKKGMISIEASSYNHDTILSVTDNGVGMNDETLQELRTSLVEGSYMTDTSNRMKNGTGIGLYNVHERIQLYYGQDYGLSIDSKHGEYTRVTIIIPRLLLEGGGELPA
ncbi:histidine kinase [Pontibacillus sp. HMF3514]|uniref:sensor histidine kinase n=1 Tax=Pontibacillus sp. HMF3514 TaxID=2692425 RepID=UPI00132009F5|nr:histidine kinase [Pontibacillus sp. HMF3514]QHE53660.1 HAMP domain-containing protein [Pontibacillus sp. HMF3514]